MAKSAEAFRTISEVADDLGIPKHVLRFWEVKFAQIRPMKRGGGRRYYRPEDMELLRGIQHLLHRDGYTIKGVQKILREQGVEAVKTHAGTGATAGGPRDSSMRDGGSAAGTGTTPTGSPPGLDGARLGLEATADGTRLDADGNARMLPTAPRTLKEQRKPAPAATLASEQGRLIAAAIAELRACQALLRGQPVPAAAVGRRGRASSSR